MRPHEMSAMLVQYCILILYLYWCAQNNLPHGAGTWTSAYGLSYSGDWKHGMICGHGTLTLPHQSSMY